MTGIFLRQGTSFVALREQRYEAETVLQELIAEHPEMLAGDDAEHGNLLLVRREAGVSDYEDGGARWSLDHLYVDAAGVPTLVEVKRSSDTRGRREVVAQMLDYAANAATSWNVEQLRAWLDEDAQRRGSSADAALREAFGVDDPDAYWTTVRTNLAAERLRLIFVSDAIGPELRRIIEFLNGQMTVTTVLGIEVKQYVDADNDHQTIVPRVVGQTQQARQAKGTTREKGSWDLESIIARIAERDPHEAQIARRLIERLTARPDVRMWFGKGARDSSAMIGGAGETKGLLAVYTTGTVEARFKYMMAVPPFDDPDHIQAFIDELNAIPGVSFPPGRFDWPTCPLLGLVDDESFERFASAFERALDEIAAGR
jgi:hypothetical protein